MKKVKSFKVFKHLFTHLKINNTTNRNMLNLIHPIITYIHKKYSHALQIECLAFLRKY